MSNESKEQRDLNIQLAHRAFDKHGSFISENNNHMVGFASLALKAPALVAAGGIAALLAFYSANWKSLSVVEGSIQTFNSILSYLFLSLIFSMIAPCLAYFCTWLIGYAAYREKYSFEHPYVITTRSSKIFRAASELIRWLTIAVVAIAIYLICAAGWVFLEFVQPFATTGG